MQSIARDASTRTLREVEERLTRQMTRPAPVEAAPVLPATTATPAAPTPALGLVRAAGHRGPTPQPPRPRPQGAVPGPSYGLDARVERVVHGGEYFHRLTTPKGRVLGGLSWRVWNARLGEAWLDRVDVEAEVRGRGGGRRLVLDALDAMRARGLQEVCLIPETPEVEDFWARFGFKRDPNTAFQWCRGLH